MKKNSNGYLVSKMDDIKRYLFGMLLFALGGLFAAALLQVEESGYRDFLQDKADRGCAPVEIVVDAKETYDCNGVLYIYEK